MSSIVFVVDIDGTVADTMGRIRDLEQRTGSALMTGWGDKETNEFLEPSIMMRDPIINGANRLLDIISSFGATLAFFTGRSERSREQTKQWLTSKLSIPTETPLFMRPDDDYRPTHVCKTDMIERQLLPAYPDSKFIFLEDDAESLKSFSKYGLALKAPDCWNVIVGPIC